MTGIEVALPFWLDRPDHEAMDVALAASDAGFDALWIGEMTTYDAFALATAVGMRAPGMPLKIGPLAVGARSPVALALGVSSVASLTGSPVDIALGASSPAIVAGWHDRRWAHHAAVMRETIECLRSILSGVRTEYDFLTTDEWRLGRAAVLRSFLERESIYSTPPMHALEATARANLTAELASLG